MGNTVSNEKVVSVERRLYNLRVDEDMICYIYIFIMYHNKNENNVVIKLKNIFCFSHPCVFERSMSLMLIAAGMTFPTTTALLKQMI